MFAVGHQRKKRLANPEFTTWIAFHGDDGRDSVDAVAPTNGSTVW